MSRLQLFGRYRLRPSLQSVAIGLALALSGVAIILPQTQRSSAPEFINEEFSVGERVYELRVVPRPQTTGYSSDAFLAEALRRLFSFVVDGPRAGEPLSRPWPPGTPLAFRGPDGFPYQVSVTRLEGEPLLWEDWDGMVLLSVALRELFPEGYEHIWEDMVKDRV